MKRWTAVLMLGLWAIGAGIPAVSAEHGPADGTLSGKATVAAAWEWDHAGPGGALRANDGGVLRIDWSETYGGGVRVAAWAHLVFVGALRNSDCRITIDDAAGTSTTSGNVFFALGGGTLPCNSGAAFEGRPDAMGLCSAGATTIGWGPVVPPRTNGSGQGAGPCQESVTKG